MPQDHAARFVATLARAVLRDGERDALAREAREALDGVFAAQKSLVLDVQFTGFTAKGTPVGGISPELLRGAGQLIMMRVSRLGFTPDARAEDLDALFEIAARGPGDLGSGGIMGAVREAAPRGIYVSTSGGDTYRPAPAPRPASAAEPAPIAEAASPEQPQPEAAASDVPEPVVSLASEPVAEEVPRADAVPEAAVDTSEDQSDASGESAADTSVSPGTAESAEDVQPEPSVDVTASGDEPADEPAAAFDEPVADDVVQPAAVETPPVPAAPAPAPSTNVLGFDLDEGDGMAFADFEVLEAFPEAGEAQPAGAAAAAPPPPSSGDDGSGGSLYNFFRSSHGQVDAEAAELPRLLHKAESLNQFDDLAQGCARTAARLVSIDQHGEALEVLEALIREAERPDRSRVFRESAVQSLRRAGTEQTLHSFLDHLQRRADDRDRVVRLFVFLGGDTVGLLEGLLFRTGDPDLRAVLFKRLAGQEGGSARLLARTMADPTPGRTRAMLELAATVGLEQDTALRWIGEAATHADSTVRMDAARHASSIGGRAGLRVLVDLLGDADRLVKRSTIQGLGTLGDPAAVPFLARLLNETSDEDVQIAVITSLGKIASADALPTLVNVVNKRQLFSGKKLVRVKIAALTAISKLPGNAAREVLATTAGGKDGELAPEARRLLSLLD